MRNGVGSTGSAPPVNVTSVACVSPQPAIGRTVRSASSGVVMILQPRARGGPVIVHGTAAHIHPQEPVSAAPRVALSDAVMTQLRRVGKGGRGFRDLA